MNSRFEHLLATGSVKKRPFGSPVDLAPLFFTSLIAGFGLARHTTIQQHAVSENSVSFIYEKNEKVKGSLCCRIMYDRKNPLGNFLYLLFCGL